MHDCFQNSMSLDRVGMVPYLSLRKEPLSRPGNRWLKRGFDVVCSLVFLCTLFPAIGLLVAIVSKCTMPRSGVFPAKKIGPGRQGILLLQISEHEGE